MPLALIAALVLAGSPEIKAPAARKVATISEAWKALPQSGDGCGGALSFDYGLEGGMRNFYCRALTVFSWKTFLGLAPVSPFLSGPHRGGKLDLASKTTFGRYDPTFVRWAVKALVPAADDPELRASTQPVYDAQVRTLARVYFKVWRVLSAAPEWTSAERDRYGAAMAKGEGDWSGTVVDLYHDTLGPSERDWGGNDPNTVRSATMWWLRRTIDETAPRWAEGLERLLKTYDASWLEAQKSKRPPKPPKRVEKPAAE